MTIQASRNASFVFFVIFAVAGYVAFASPIWFDSILGRTGLWQVCDLYGQCARLVGFAAHTTIPQVLMTVAIVCYFAAFVTYCWWTCKPQSYILQHGVGAVGKTALGLSVFGGLCNIAAVIVFLIFRIIYFHNMLIMFYVASVAGLGDFLDGAISLCAIKGKPQNTTNDTSMTTITTVTSTTTAPPDIYPNQQQTFTTQQPIQTQQLAYPPQQVAYPTQQVAYPQQQVAYPAPQVAYLQQPVPYKPQY